MISYRYLILILVVLIGISCDSKNNRQLPEDKMSELMLDIAIADEIIRLYPPNDRDSMRNVLTQSLLKIHKLDRSDLDTNLYLYTRDFERLGSTIKLITERASAFQEDALE